MTLHNGTTRNTTEVTLAGRGAEINLCGMVIADKNEQVDNHTFIDHKVADCTSNELFKYVLDDQATGAFAGKVLVREGAQHTNSQQPTATSVLLVMPICTLSRNWKFMRMT